MQVELKVSEGVKIMADGETHTDLFENLANMQEVFGEEKCGKCSNTQLRFVVRKDKDENKYYELQCSDFKCKAKLSFGCHKKGGGLFPKRYESKDGENLKDENGKNKVRGTWGWTIYNRETGKEE